MSRRGKRGKWKPGGLPSWEDIKRVYGEVLVEDIKRALDENWVISTVSEASASTRLFLGFLDADKEPSSKALVDILSGRNCASLSEAQEIQLVIIAFNRLSSDERLFSQFSETTKRKYQTDAAYLMQWLGELQERSYPGFKRRFIVIPQAVGNVPSLGELHWKEVAHLKGAAKERLALEILKADSIARFDVLAAINLFGQNILAPNASPPNTDISARKMLRTVLAAEDSCWRRTGRSQFDHRNAIAPEVQPLLKTLRDPQTWLAAGLPRSVTTTFAPKWSMPSLSRCDLPSLVLSCLGPTTDMTMSVKAVLCCESGWNRQPIYDLPANPFVFRTYNRIGVATGAFIESFKNRASHEVVAYVGRTDVVPELLEDLATANWNATANIADINGSGDGFAILTRDSSLLSLLERYAAIANGARCFDINRQWENNFFFSMTQHHGLSRRTNRNLKSQHGNSGIINRDGVSYQSIRKSYLAVRVNSLDSVGATRPFAGHRSTSVLLPHYLNTPDFNNELDESIRFFQNAMQALIVGRRPELCVKLNLSKEDAEWFSRLAVAAGIAAAVGLLPETNFRTNRTEMLFKPTEDNLTDLFLAHRALRLSKARTSPGRWKIQALPLIACVKAIGKVIFEKGLYPAYVRTARRASRNLMQGLICLPPVLES